MYEWSETRNQNVGKESRIENLHGGEVPLPVEDELHLHVSLSPQGVVPPAQVVVARPHVVLTRQQEVVQADHAVRQLAHPAKQPPVGRDSCQSHREQGDRKQWRVSSACDSPPLMYSVIRGVVEAGDGITRRHHELTLRSAVGDQAVCKTVGKDRLKG